MSHWKVAVMLGVFAEFETNLRKERQLEGIAKAKASGVYKGRKPSIDVEQVRAMKAQGIGPALSRRQTDVGALFEQCDPPSEHPASAAIFRPSTPALRFLLLNENAAAKRGAGFDITARSGVCAALSRNTR